MPRFGWQTRRARCCVSSVLRWCLEGVTVSVINIAPLIRCSVVRRHWKTCETSPGTPDSTQQPVGTDMDRSHTTTLLFELETSSLIGIFTEVRLTKVRNAIGSPVLSSRALVGGLLWSVVRFVPRVNELLFFPRGYQQVCCFTTFTWFETKFRG